MALCATCGEENPERARFCLGCGSPLALAPPPPPPVEERKVITAVFTDIVGSTTRAAALGDAPWRDLLAEHDRIVHNARTRAYVERFATPDKQIIEYPGAHHTLEFEPNPDPYIDTVLRWLEERLPSGQRK